MSKSKQASIKDKSSSSQSVSRAAAAQSTSFSMSDFKSEFSKIVWPTREHVTKSTVIIFVILFFYVGLIFLFDILFSNGYNLLNNAF